jgi:outer membrane protein
MRQSLYGDRISRKSLFRGCPGGPWGVLVPIALAWALILSPAGLYAAEKTVTTVTLDEAYRMAIVSHESVKIAGEGVVQAESNIDKANAVLLPSLKASGNYTRYSKEVSNGSFVVQPRQSTEFDVTLTQPLYHGGTWSARRQASILLDRSREGLGYSKDTIVIITARAYFDVLRSKKNVEIQNAALKRAREEGAVAAARFKVGEVTKSAVLRAEAETAGAEAALTNAETALMDSKTVLKRIIGAADEIDVVEPATTAEVTSSLDQLVNTAYAQRRDYRQSALDKTAAAEGIKVAKGGYWPSLDLEGLFANRDQSPKTTFFQKQTISGAILFNFPIFEGGLTRAQVSQAKSVYNQAELTNLSLKRDIAVQVSSAYDRLQALKAITESFRKQVSFAEENYSMVFQQFKFGTATTVDVIDASTTLISAQSSLSNATYDQGLAAVELKYDIGTVMEEVAAR